MRRPEATRHKISFNFMGSADKEAIVIDVGNGTCRAGFAGREIPNLIIPSAVGSSHSFHINRKCYFISFFWILI